MQQIRLGIQNSEFECRRETLSRTGLPNSGYSGDVWEFRFRIRMLRRDFGPQGPTEFRIGVQLVSKCC